MRGSTGWWRAAPAGAGYSDTVDEGWPDPDSRETVEWALQTYAVRDALMWVGWLHARRVLNTERGGLSRAGYFRAMQKVRHWREEHRSQ